MPRTLDPFRLLLVAVAGWMNHQQQQVNDYLREENRVLREQLGSKPLRFDDDQRRRLAVRGKALGRKVLADIATVVTPETLLRWHRKLIAEKYDGTAKRAPGRPRTAGQLAALIVRMATENRDWGYRRIQGALSNLEHIVARTTIANILKRHGLEPAPERSRKTTWKEFLSRHWELIVAADFFTVEVWTRRGLQRFLVLFFIDLSSRRVKIAGIGAQANGLWMSQIARELTDPVDGLLLGKQYLIHDRDPLFTAAFQKILAEVGIESVKLAATVTEPQRLCRTFCADHPGVVLGPADILRRKFVAPGSARVRGALPPGTKSSGPEQSAHYARGDSDKFRRIDSTTTATRRNVELLSSCSVSTSATSASKPYCRSGMLLSHPLLQQHSSSPPEPKFACRSALLAGDLACGRVFGHFGVLSPTQNHLQFVTIELNGKITIEIRILLFFQSHLM